MATTSPDNLRTPNPGDPYNLVPDLQTLANDVQAALTSRDGGAVGRGTAAQRATALAGSLPGRLWQDTDGIRMLWKRGTSAWEPAVWRWSGTTAQMNAFTQAPDGFEWFNTTTSVTNLRTGGAWVPGDTGWIDATILAGNPGTLGGQPQYRRVNGVTYLRGLITPTANNQTFFVLPAGFRAVGTFYTWADRGLASVRCGVTSGGEIQYIGPGGDGAIRLSSYTPWPADQ